MAVLEVPKKKLAGRFKTTDTGDVSLVLGVLATRDRGQGNSVDKPGGYTKYVLEKIGRGEWNPLNTPGGEAELSLELPEENLSK